MSRRWRVVVAGGSALAVVFCAWTIASGIGVWISLAIASTVLAVTLAAGAE